MDIRERLIALREEQRKISTDYEEILKAYNSNELVNENNELKQTLSSAKSELEKIRRELSAAQNDNDRLKLALQEQIWNERLNILKISREKLDAYFGRAQQGQKDQLSLVEHELKEKLCRIKQTADRRLTENKVEINQKIGQLETELEERLRAEEARCHTENNEFNLLTNDQYQTLKEQDLSPETLKERARQNQIEMKIGLNWINKIGILLILFGVGAAFRYSFPSWDNHLKSAVFFLLGGLFMAGGELFFRKKKTVFASGLIGGGVAILYGSIFYTFFLLHLKEFSIYTALGLSVLVTVSTVLLSLRYDSQTIGSFGLVGGFLPFISFVWAYGLDAGNILLLMGYLFILNMALLLISLKKQWNILSYLSFMLNTISTIYLVEAGSLPLLGIAYAMATFLMYLSVTLAYPLVNKKPLIPADVILLGLNTAISSLLVFSLCDKAGLGSYRGTMAILFCLVYFGLGILIQKMLSAEKWSQYLFYATSLTFAILTIPFQILDMHWWALGWTVEAVILILIGSQKTIRAMEYTGWGIFLLCSFIFGVSDLLPYLGGLAVAPYFEVRYLVVTLGQLLILFNYQLLLSEHKISLAGNTHELIMAYKYLAITGFWVYLTHLGDILCRQMIDLPGIGGFYRFMTFSLITIAYGYAIARLRPFADKVTRGMAVAFYILADLICVLINLFYPVFPMESSYILTAQVWGFGILILFNVFVFLNLRVLILSYLRRDGFNLENYPVLLGIFLLANSTAAMIVQLHLGFANILFSLFYLVMALGFIGYGFIKKVMTIRHWGLGLVIFATGKFFIFDLSYLEALGKIAAYFGFGLVLLAISFVYQKVKSNTEVNTNHAPKA